ncbi:MAG TPA: ATP-dependent Clp protease adaptor ClpS, partial [Phycisphaerae bacterium]|nr:ATP-dependent Clp protease adaptor ClpS [Phycisphaerae bacterium]
MSDQQKEVVEPVKADNTPATAVKEKPQKTPAPAEPRQLPPYKVLLHNDDVNDMGHVVHSILKVTRLSLADAEQRMAEAHLKG